ncbi:serine/threonine protein kinase [Thioalkalivibrio sp. XN8]|uniref:serine/threonine protein kinase n=1 Tax=Thioalkalivibrio sp. XN8 TaxID=2712863 RepID=UPI0013EB0BBE|nr:serine/threonine protein kinase [Thioalkalivibrio sp. XN8]NGP54011.1 serine/threonine protein kinase [Thioalkalivibrio sp. XN8]
MNEARDDTLAYQDLQPNDILAAVESLELRCDGRLLPLNSYENRVYQVGLDEGSPVVAKFYRPGRWSDAAIQEEHDFAAELAERDVPVVPPLRRAGSSLHRHAAFRFSVSPRVAGREPELDDLGLLRQVGRLVGRLHLCGELRDFVHRPRLTPARLGTESSRFLLEHGFLPEPLRPAYESLCRDLLAAVEDAWALVQPREIRLHGDFHPGNVLVHDGQVRIVDLDDCVSGPAVQDLWMFLSGERAEQEPQLAELLAGYLEFRRFDLAELRLVEPLRSLRIMHYAAWIARRWQDPAFRIAFPWFGTPRYWDEHVLSLREQLALVQEPPLEWLPPQTADNAY